VLLGWQRICSRFYESRRFREKYLLEQEAKGISVVRNMGNSYDLKGKGVDHVQASLPYIFTLPTFQFVCLDKKNMK
jgi:hypothetical protein